MQLKRSIEQMKERVRIGDETAAEMRRAHESDLASKEEGLSELRGENSILKATIESLERARASSGGAGMLESTDFGDGAAPGSKDADCNVSTRVVLLASILLVHWLHYNRCC